MPSRRSKLEVYIDIMAKIKGGECRPTRIMYKTNLSWRPLRQILESLESQGMIKATESGDHRSRILYSITEKGDNVLKYFEKGKNMLELVATPDLEAALENK
jgi:predicted transcriptional regulator